jgi:hypothetical protein
VLYFVFCSILYSSSCTLGSLSSLLLWGYYFVVLHYTFYWKHIDNDYKRCSPAYLSIQYRIIGIALTLVPTNQDRGALYCNRLPYHKARPIIDVALCGFWSVRYTIE